MLSSEEAEHAIDDIRAEGYSTKRAVNNARVTVDVEITRGRGFGSRTWRRSIRWSRTLRVVRKPEIVQSRSSDSSDNRIPKLPA